MIPDRLKIIKLKLERKLFIFLYIIKKYLFTADYNCFTINHMHFNRCDDDPFYTSMINNEAIDGVIVVGDANYGNAIIKLANALCLAQTIGVSFVYHQIRFWSGNEFKIGTITVKHEYPPLFMNCIHSECFNRKSFTDVNFENFPVYVEALLNHVDGLKQEIDKISNDAYKYDLIIHIRSGDVFNRNNPHPLYGQPPLQFYKNIIESNNYKSIRIIAECESNPVLNILLKMNSISDVNVVWERQDLIRDLAFLAIAKNVVLSRGTFPHSLVFYDHAQRNKTVYLYDYYPSQWVLGSDEIKFWGYRSRINSVRYIERDTELLESITINWKNSPEQCYDLVNRGSSYMEILR